jgi:hypothetical protein
MTSRNLTLLAISGLVLVMTTPLPAQSIRLTANIPFEFVTGTQTLPAGDYVVDTTANNGAVRVWNQETHDASTVLANPRNEPFIKANAEVKLVFNHYGNQYFLARIWDGTSGTGRDIPMGKAERALSETAVSRAPETLVILARR